MEDLSGLIIMKHQLEKWELKKNVVFKEILLSHDFNYISFYVDNYYIQMYLISFKEQSC